MGIEGAIEDERGGAWRLRVQRRGADKATEEERLNLGLGFRLGFRLGLGLESESVCVK